MTDRIVDFPSKPGPTPRELPCNVGAEQALLGILFYDNAAFERVPDYFQARHFYEPFHARVYYAMGERLARGDLADMLVLADQFRLDPAFNELGGMGYFANLLDNAPPSANTADYAKTIIDLSLRRDLIALGGEIAVAAGDEAIGSTSAQEQISTAEARLYGLAEGGQGSSGFVTFADALQGALEMAAAAFSLDGSLAGVSTGLIDLDKKLGGLHPSDLLILAGRPSMGKTALAVNIAFHVARTYAFELALDGGKQTTAGGVVAFFSLEMSAEQLAMRLLSEVSGVPGDRLRKGELDHSEFSRVRDAALEIQEAPLHIDATGGLSIAKLAARARRLKRTVGLDLIVVDYLQLLTNQQEGKRYDGRVNEVSQITQGLKALAKDLGVPIIALSQLSRKVEEREDKRPQLADLRESGSIEQDADAVMFVYRESYYLGRMEPDAKDQAKHFEWQEKMDDARNTAEIIIGKQRHGPIGTVKVAFNEDITKFSNLARSDRYETR